MRKYNTRVVHHCPLRQSHQMNFTVFLNAWPLELTIQLFKNYQGLNLSSQGRRVKSTVVWPRFYSEFPSNFLLHVCDQVPPCLERRSYFRFPARSLFDPKSGEAFTQSQSSVPMHLLSSNHPEKPGSKVLSDLLYSPYCNVGALFLSSSCKNGKYFCFIQCCNIGFMLWMIRLLEGPVTATLCWI